MALISTKAEIKAFAPASLGLEVNDVLPFIDEIEREQIKKILGTALFEQLKTAYAASISQTPTPLTEEMAALLKEVRRPLVDLALARYIPMGSVQVSSQGIQEIQTETNRSATKWRTEKLEKSLLDGGFKKLEDLFEFLEENRPDYPDWDDSEEFSLLYELFVYKANIFNKHHDIGNSRRIFIALKAIMMRIENQFIRPILLKNLFDLVKTQQKAGTLTDENKFILVNYIHPAVTLLTVAKGLIEKSLFLDENGATVYKTVNTMAFVDRTDAKDQRIAMVAGQLQCSGEDLLHNLNQYLKDNISDYPVLLAEENYNPDGFTQLTNTPEGKSFKLM